MTDYDGEDRGAEFQKKADGRPAILRTPELFTLWRTPACRQVAEETPRCGWVAEYESGQAIEETSAQNVISGDDGRRGLTSMNAHAQPLEWPQPAPHPATEGKRSTPQQQALPSLNKGFTALSSQHTGGRGVQARRPQGAGPADAGE